MPNRLAFDEFLASQELTAAERKTIDEALELAKKLGVVCTGTAGFEDCTWPPFKLLFLHGRPVGLCCPECAQLNGAMFIGMGHGAYRVEGLLEFKHDEAYIQRVYNALRRQPVHEVAPGQFWTFNKEHAWRAELAEYMHGRE